jgi:peptidoglycan-associated lipoprotein
MPQARQAGICHVARRCRGRPLARQYHAIQISGSFAMQENLRKFAFVAAVAAMTAQGACTSNPSSDSDVSGRGNANQQLSSADMNAGNLAGNVRPGSEEDLQKNVGDRVFFDTDKIDVKPEGRTTLERQAEWLKRYPNVTVTIEGHADERGTREYNLALGDRRATSVKNILASLGVDPRRLHTISYGKERPAVVGSNEAAWAQNRRGVTVVD